MNSIFLIKTKKIIIIPIVLVLLLIVVIRFWSPEDTWLCKDGAWIKHGNPEQRQPTTTCENASSTISNPKACTEEAKICPDGSTVGRTGPNCEFTPCPEIKSLLSEAEARVIAEKTCIKGGETLAPGTYNKNSKTWWYDANLNATRKGCNPACVVNEETKTAEINWRCTGAIVPDSGVEGTVTIGPTCPVIREGDLSCADKPYITTIQVVAVGSPQSSPFATTKSDAGGNYKILLPPGEYALQPVGGALFPRCETKNITIEAFKIITTNLSCDTGIR